MYLRTWVQEAVNLLTNILADDSSLCNDSVVRVLAILSGSLLVVVNVKSPSFGNNNSFCVKSAQRYVHIDKYT